MCDLDKLAGLLRLPVNVLIAFTGARSVRIDPSDVSKEDLPIEVQQVLFQFCVEQAETVEAVIDCAEHLENDALRKLTAKRVEDLVSELIEQRYDLGYLDRLYALLYSQPPQFYSGSLCLMQRELVHEILTIIQSAKSYLEMKGRLEGLKCSTSVIEFAKARRCDYFARKMLEGENLDQVSKAYALASTGSKIKADALCLLDRILDERIKAAVGIKEILSVRPYLRPELSSMETWQNKVSQIIQEVCLGDGALSTLRSWQQELASDLEAAKLLKKKIREKVSKQISSATDCVSVAEAIRALDREDPLVDIALERMGELFDQRIVLGSLTEEEITCLPKRLMTLDRLKKLIEVTQNVCIFQPS
ncbi:MAG: hypothetical protein IT292_10855 [Deltaproteobacteria bacterium]|nr:hypothetical protein [Deltaproteobacteria bacterium]